jgi:hypothetical protein
VIIALVVYGVVAVWGIPREIAKQRNHPHQDAIGASACSRLARSGCSCGSGRWPIAQTAAAGLQRRHHPPLKG